VSRHRYPIAILSLFVLFASATLPSPLYELYRRDWGISAATIGVVFAVYACSLIPSLILLGRLSDDWGRRRTMILGLAVAALGMIVFAFATNVPWLIAARIVQGVAMGVCTGAAAAAILEWSPAAIKPRVGQFTAVTMSAGAGAGPLLAGLLAQYAPLAHVLSYAVMTAILAAVIAALFTIPSDTPGPEHHHKGGLIGVPREMLGAFVLASAESFLGWASFALYLSLVPSYIATLLNVHNLLVGGGVIAFLQAASIAAVLRLGRIAVAPMIVTAMSLLIAGLALVVVAVPLHATAIVALSAVCVGAGAGLSITAGLTLINAHSPADRRGEVLSAYYIWNYLGFSVPSFIVGAAATAFGFFPAFCGAAVVIGSAAAVIGLLMLRRGVQVIAAA
jgi:MFS family permease